MGSQVLGWILASRAHSCAAGPNVIRHRRMSRQLVVEDLNLRVVVHDYVILQDVLTLKVPRTSTATPGQAGLPAEFKHINKRRKRNLQGFP